jgi:hypothetical protein
MKRLLVAGVIMLFLGSTIPEYEAVSVQPSSTAADSYHVFYENQTWTVISCNFTEPTDVTFRMYQNNTYKRGDTFNFLIEDVSKNGEPLFGGIGWGGRGVSPDYYFQTKFGPINISFSHSPRVNGGCGGGSGSSMNNCTGHYQFLIISYGPANTLEVWLNFSRNTTISVTSGSEVFAFQRDDFIGNLNMGWKHGTFILNGKKQITVKNSLYCFYETDWWGGFGYEFLHYTTPAGDQARHCALNYQYRTFLDFTRNDFEDHLRNGENGTWTFSINYLMVAGLTCPNIFLFGADIQLP